MMQPWGEAANGSAAAASDGVSGHFHGCPDCGEDCAHCGDPADAPADCRSCGEPTDNAPTCDRCHAASWRGLCARCRGAAACAELAGFDKNLRHAILTFEPDETPDQIPADKRLADRLDDAIREEYRAERLERATEAYEHGELNTELLESHIAPERGGNHEGWAHDKWRDERGRPIDGAPADLEQLSARGHIERATRKFRLAQAGRHAARSKLARREASRLKRRLKKGLPEEMDKIHPEARRFLLAELQQRAVDHESTASWHAGRARGQRERFFDLQRCGDGWADITCKCCEKENAKDGGNRGRRRRKVGCSVNRACVACRDRRANHRRAIFWRARADVLDECRSRGLLRNKRRGGRWSEKDFTLTLPDAAITGKYATERRIKILFKAWRTFTRRMSRHFRERPHMPFDALTRKRLAPWWHAAFEITPGADGFGHAHWHVWFVGPWIRQDDIRKWWAEALRKEGIGVAAEDLIKPVLREVRCHSIVSEVYKGSERIKLVPKETKNKRGAARRRQAEDSDQRPHHVDYIEGWSISTVGKKGKPNMSANTQARVYMALEKRRTVRCTRGFLMRGYKANACPACGNAWFVTNAATGEVVPAMQATVTTWRSPRWEAPAERGPPLHKARPRQLELLETGTAGRGIDAST
jgi:hypothetical protein